MELEPVSLSNCEARGEKLFCAAGAGLCVWLQIDHCPLAVSCPPNQKLEILLVFSVLLYFSFG